MPACISKFSLLGVSWDHTGITYLFSGMKNPDHTTLSSGGLFNRDDHSKEKLLHSKIATLDVA